MPVDGGYDSGSESEMDDVQAFPLYTTSEAMFTALRAQVIGSPKDLHFKGKVVLPADPSFDAMQRVKQTVIDVAVFWCSQDAQRKRAPLPSTKPDAKPRETPGMDRFPCRSRLAISCHRGGKDHGPYTLSVTFKHALRHIVYRDTSMPAAAIAFIRDAPESLSPSALADQVAARFDGVSRAQQAHYKRDDDPLKSAALLLKEMSDLVDVFEPVGVPDGVVILAWGMKKIAGPLREHLSEVAMDATYNTNSRNLELYAIMGELDNAGFPIAYCLLTTASAISQGKRKKSLSAFLSCVKAAYGINPEFTHVDKDTGEISALQAIFPRAKVSICWWHVDDAVGKRLRKAKLSTTPYKPAVARQQFDFIALDFRPVGKPDKDEYEGGKPEDLPAEEDAPPPASLNPSRLPFRLPVPQPSPPRRLDGTGIPILRLPPGPFIYIDGEKVEGLEDHGGTDEDDHGGTDEDGEGSESGEVTGQKRKRKEGVPTRVFCPEGHRAQILELMRQHSHMHPLIPGYCHPSPRGIWYWAAKQMYDLCVAHDLREAWAWRKLKHDYLHEYHSPRVDLLVWVINSRLCTIYSKKLIQFTTYLGRTRIDELPSWRKTFRSIWRALENREESDRVYDAYRPDVKRWVCSCPAFVTSRFLVCKHLVLSVKPVPTKFFREARRQRTTPFWQHSTLIPLTDADQSAPEEQDAAPRDLEVPDNEDDEPYIETQADRDFEASAATFEAELDAEIIVFEQFLAGMKYQRQFRDRRMLEMFRKKGAGLKRLAETCLAKETAPTRTSDPDFADAMFYRPRPRDAEPE
ncbi:SWIM-type domain-containing protein [Mycena kentingensis (nom. inval.)]|nr:SWIM-type domain-containing protein [Mycena kentingensis (nom. inval.)]